MDSNPAPDEQSGIALFMVIAAMSILSLLVTEFSYIAQINQKIAYDGLDQVKAHYLAKSGLKLSLLRLKAYQTLKGITPAALGAGGTAGGGSLLPKSILDKIWGMPFFYPIPTELLQLTQNEKDQIKKFEQASNLDGRFSAVIESESSRYNLNSLLASFSPTEATPEPTEKAPPAGGAQPPGSGGRGGSKDPGPSPTPGSSGSPIPFSPEEARKSLGDYLWQILSSKFESDADFASEYRDYKIEELVDSVAAWADRSYERKNSSGHDPVPMKRAPFYSTTELHMIPGMDDTLYDIFEPSLTARSTPGININTLKKETLKALVPQMTADELNDFIKYRDSQEEDNAFKTVDEFYSYLIKNVSAFRGAAGPVNEIKEVLAKRQMKLIVDESEFKITVQAKVNQSVRKIEAWVSLGGSSGTKAGPTATPQPNASPTPSGSGDAGLKITFMRIL